MDDYTGAEIFQMWAERMRTDWQHTSTLAAYINNANVEKKKDKRTPEQLNPMEQNRQSTGIPLNTEDGFRALQSVAQQWRKP